MQVWQGVASVGVILLADMWQVVWAVSLSAAFVIFAGPMLWGCIKRRRAKRRDAREAQSPAAAYTAAAHPSLDGQGVSRRSLHTPPPDGGAGV